MTHLQEELFKLQDTEYRDFNSSLIPGIEKETVIGVRTPVLRKFAKEYAKSGETEQFMRELPHKYYEENNLHMMLIGQIKDYAECISELEKFLPYIDNWATVIHRFQNVLIRIKKIFLKGRRSGLQQIPHMLKDTEWAL